MFTKDDDSDLISPKTPVLVIQRRNDEMRFNGGTSYLGATDSLGAQVDI